MRLAELAIAIGSEMNAALQAAFPDSLVGEKSHPTEIVCTDAFSSYEVLDVSELRHERINYHVTFVDARNTSMEVKTSDTAKRYLRCFNGIPRQPLSAQN